MTKKRKNANLNASRDNRDAWGYGKRLIDASHIPKLQPNELSVLMGIDRADDERTAKEIRVSSSVPPLVQGVEYPKEVVCRNQAYNLRRQYKKGTSMEELVRKYDLRPEWLEEIVLTKGPLKDYYEW